MAIVEITCIFLGFVAGVILQWFLFKEREQKLTNMIRSLQLQIGKRVMLEAITTPIVREFAKEICKSIFGGKKK